MFTRLKPCPFCKSTDLLVGYISAMNFAVECLKCHANGPVFTFPEYAEQETLEELETKLTEKAKEAWDKRYD